MARTADLDRILIVILPEGVVGPIISQGTRYQLPETILQFRDIRIPQKEQIRKRDDFY
jgi:hypothetical protein